MMIRTTDKQKKTLKGFDANLKQLQAKANEINQVKSAYLTAILEGKDVSAEDEYELTKSYDLEKVEEDKE